MGEETKVGFFEWSDIRLDGGEEGGAGDLLGGLFRFGEVFGDLERMAWAWLGRFVRLGSAGEEVYCWRNGEIGTRRELWKTKR